MPLLDEGEIRHRLGELKDWDRSGDAIHKTYGFDSFPEAIAFVNRIAELAESADHHPDIDIRYDQVSLGLSTHSAGGLTAKDFDLARSIDAAR